MKRIVGFLMAALVLVQLLACSVTVLAVDPAAISLSSADGREGDVVNLSVSIIGNTGFGGLDINVKFDKNVLEFVGAECKIEGGYFQSSPIQSANAEGQIDLAYVGIENFSADGALFDITFTIKEGAAEGDSAVTLILDDSSFVYDGEVNMKDFTANVSGAKVSVSKGLLGDVNLDGTIDAKDLTVLARHSAKIEYITDSRALANADINQDGNVTASDLTKLARHVAKIEFIVQ